MKKILEEEGEKLKKEEILPLFTTAYYIAFHDYSFLDAEKLLKFLAYYQVKVYMHYRNDIATKETMECISHSFRSAILRAINA